MSKSIVSGRLKGSGFELEICKKLSRWRSKGERNDLFVRNITSGGAFTLSARAGKREGTGGDVMGSDPRAHAFLQTWFIEAKFWKDLGLEVAIWKKTGEFYRVIQKAQKQSRDAHRQMMVIAKQNHFPALCFISRSIFDIDQLSGIDFHVLWNNRIVSIRFDDILSIEPEEFDAMVIKHWINPR